MVWRKLVERLLKTDLAELGPKLERQTVALGEREDGLPFLVRRIGKRCW